MQWRAAVAVLSCLAASTSALGSDLKFTARIGGELAQTTIAWDGSTLTVPQHCRQETCTDNARELVNMKTELADELSKLRDLLAEQKADHEKHLQTELRKQKALHDAELRTIAGRLAAVEVAAGTNDQSIDVLRAADLSHQSQISANDHELTSLQETDRDHANQIDSNYERVNDADKKTFYLHQMTMQHQEGIDANANAIKGVGQTLEATAGELRQADLRHDDAIARVSKMEGPRGLQGGTGPRGERGADGADGRDGVDGQDGIDGKDGKDGIDGKDGVDGRDGIDGKDGKDGIDGRDAGGGSIDVVARRDDEMFSPGVSSDGLSLNVDFDLGCSGTRAGSCAEGQSMSDKYTNLGVTFKDTNNVATSYAYSAAGRPGWTSAYGFMGCNGPFSGWGNNPMYVFWNGSVKPSHIGFFHVGGHHPTSEMTVVIKYEGGKSKTFTFATYPHRATTKDFFGFHAKDISEIKISGSSYAIDDLRWQL